MKKFLRIIVSLIVAFAGTVLIAGTVMKTAIVFIRPPNYEPTWYHWLVPITMFGSLILSPVLFGLCYMMLSGRAHKP